MKAARLEIDIETALKRVGRTPAEHAEWLLRFSKTALMVLTPAERFGWRLEAGVFLESVDAALTSAIFLPIRRQVWLEQPPRKIALTPKNTRELQRFLRDGLKRVTQGEAWTATLRINEGFRPANGRLVPVFEGRVDEALVFKTFRDAMVEGHPVLFCPECGTLFVRRGRKEYCSTRCSQTARTRRWREKHPERARELRTAQQEREYRAKKGMRKPKIWSQRARVKQQRQRPWLTDDSAIERS